jgi:1-deoxy-D-xylulose-5-phosphate synthase
MVYPALEASAKLAKEGIDLAVVNARFVKPLDEEMILRFGSEGKTVITAEEGVVAGGFGSAVREFLDRQRNFRIRFLSIGLPLDVYPPGKAEEIRKKYGLDSEGLYRRIRDFYAQK